MLRFIFNNKVYVRQRESCQSTTRERKNCFQNLVYCELFISVCCPVQIEKKNGTAESRYHLKVIKSKINKRISNNNKSNSKGNNNCREDMSYTQTTAMLNIARILRKKNCISTPMRFVVTYHRTLK